jgi:hypothetical protein
LLEAWKRTAERAAALELELPGTDDRTYPEYAKAERRMPELLEEMREDLLRSPTTREFVVVRSTWSYTLPQTHFGYFLDKHEDLEGKVTILKNLSLIREITSTDLRRFLFEEHFVDYLTGG